MRPHKIEWGSHHEKYVRHIDLDHVLAIDEPEFIDRMGGGGYFAEFEIHMMFLDKPLRVSTYCEADHGPSEWTADGYLKSDRRPGYPRPVMLNGEPEGVARLRVVFNDLYKAWVNK